MAKRTTSTSMLWGAADMRRVPGAWIARAFGVTKQSQSAWVNCPRNDDGTYSLPDCVQWWKAKFENDMAAVDGADSPNLERYRKTQADMAEYKLAQLRGEIVRRDDIREGLGAISGVLRRAVDRIRTISEASADVLLDAIEQSEQMIDRRFAMSTLTVEPEPEAEVLDHE